MDEILKSNLVHQISVFCAVFLPLFLIVRLYRIIKFKDYSKGNYIYIISCIIVLLLIFTLVFNDYQRLFLGYFLVFFAILFLLIFSIDKVIRRR
ncbi:hypothetical protein SAMN04488522_101901 [Pedobacter caeni]|uniref:Uncharacterized protein n=1 Tax=Pedobacter caeni TaxID=288992 RepID=A0A1M4VGC5_9SPHI|nr:hypothetical protein SAMN04488522_101901 [Pedobacter caeni]